MGSMRAAANARLAERELAGWLTSFLELRREMQISEKSICLRSYRIRLRATQFALSVTRLPGQFRDSSRHSEERWRTESTATVPNIPSSQMNARSIRTSLA